MRVLKFGILTALLFLGCGSLALAEDLQQVWSCATPPGMGMLEGDSGVECQTPAKNSTDASKLCMYVAQCTPLTAEFEKLTSEIYSGKKFLQLSDVQQVRIGQLAMAQGLVTRDKVIAMSVICFADKTPEGATCPGPTRCVNMHAHLVPTNIPDAVATGAGPTKPFNVKDPMGNPSGVRGVTQ